MTRKFFIIILDFICAVFFSSLGMILTINNFKFEICICYIITGILWATKMGIDMAEFSH